MMKMKYPSFPLDDEYLFKANTLTNVSLVILGRDPYPSGASSIPFVKSKWKDLKKGSAGYNVFNSLFNEFPSESFATPKDCAFSLLDSGVVFMNCSYNYLNEETVSKVKHFVFITSAFDTNVPILERANVILACGDGYKMLEMVAILDTSIVKKVPHPSTQSRNGASVDESEWDQIWSQNMLNKSIQTPPKRSTF